jgi:hypothetical protein
MAAGGIDLLACSISAWYPRLRRVSIKSELVQLPDAFVQYLLEDHDGIFIPPPRVGGASSPGWTDDEESADDADAPPPPRTYGFDVEPLFAQIDEAIQRLGGGAFPKLNWSSPRDSAWVLGGSLRCVNANDVVTLLKCSQHIAHDLRAHDAVVRDASAPGAGWVLALRSWCNLHPAGEFRCFAAGGRLLAVSQRDRFTHYPHLEADRADLLERLRTFWAATPIAPAGGALAVDVYVDSARRVHVIDLSPFSEASTDPILFEWAELQALAAAEDAASPLELRLVGAGTAGVTLSARMYAGVPLDLQPHALAGADDGREQDAAAESAPPVGDVASAVELVRSALRLTDSEPPADNPL